jgi:hypothetical protein
MSRYNELEHHITNGTISVCTERECGTHISIWIAPGNMFGVIVNTPANRRFLKAALKRMERDKAVRPKYTTHSKSCSYWTNNVCNCSTAPQAEQVPGPTGEREK